MSDLPKPMARDRQEADMYCGHDGAREIAPIHKYHLGRWNWHMT
jgi:hypothetical protein